MLTVMRGPAIGRQLAAALIGRLGAGAALQAHIETPWASITFVGTRHQLQIACRDATTAARAATLLPAAEFTLRGHIVADLIAEADGPLLTVAVLTLVAA